jgi:RNA polymerase sigma factor (sigma-70 family)
MPQKKAEKIDCSLSEADLKLRRGKLENAIEEFEPNLVMDIRMYLKQFKLTHLLENTEDFWSEVKITALRNAENYNPECSAKAWLRQAAFHLVQHLYRDEKRRLPTASISEVAQELGFDRNIEKSSESELFDYLRQKSINGFFKENQLSAEEILSVVDEEDRRILRLRFVGGLSAKEIASHFGISEGAADVKLWRAKNRLRKGFLKQ